jgi:hypothetical protein
MSDIQKTKIYDQKTNTQLVLKFTKKVVTFVAKINEHKNRIYFLNVKHGDPEKNPNEFFYTLVVSDAEVDRVDPTTIPGEYKFYMASGKDCAPEVIFEALLDRTRVPLMPGTNDPYVGCLMPSNYRDTMFHIEELDYDVQYLTNEVFDFLKKGMKEFKDGGYDKVKPYYPMAYANISYIMGKLFGDVAASIMINHPSTDFFTFVWLHGYAMQSALKNAGVTLRADMVPVPKETIDQMRADYESFLSQLSEKLRDTEEGNDDDSTSN